MRKNTYRLTISYILSAVRYEPSITCSVRHDTCWISHVYTYCTCPWEFLLERLGTIQPKTSGFLITCMENWNQEHWCPTWICKVPKGTGTALVLQSTRTLDLVVLQSRLYHGAQSTCLGRMSEAIELVFGITDSARKSIHNCCIEPTCGFA